MRRGRAVLVGLAALVVAGAGVVVAATREPASDVVAVGPTSTTPTSTIPSSTTSTVVGVTTTALPATTARPASPTTTARPATTTTAKPPAPTTTSTARPGVACTPAQVAVAITTDRPRYGPGQPVHATSTLRNKSSSACTYNGYTFSAAFLDAAGAPVFPVSTLVADSFADVLLQPGQVLSNNGDWDHRSAPAGVYTAKGTWVFAGFTYDVTTTLILS